VIGEETIVTYTFSGESEGKGRNGYFKLHELDVWEDSEGKLNFDFFSSRRGGNCGPARLILTVEDLKVLRDASVGILAHRKGKDTGR
jgi:hypothetical protein